MSRRLNLVCRAVCQLCQILKIIPTPTITKAGFRAASNPNMPVTRIRATNWPASASHLIEISALGSTAERVLTISAALRSGVLGPVLDIQIRNFQGIILNELTPFFNRFTHQGRECQIGFIFIINPDLKECPLVRV